MEEGSALHVQEQVILLDERGKDISSEDMAHLIAQVIEIVAVALVCNACLYMWVPMEEQDTLLLHQWFIDEWITGAWIPAITFDHDLCGWLHTPRDSGL